MTGSVRHPLGHQAALLEMGQYMTSCFATDYNEWTMLGCSQFFRLSNARLDTRFVGRTTVGPTGPLVSSPTGVALDSKGKDDLDCHMDCHIKLHKESRHCCGGGPDSPRRPRMPLTSWLLFFSSAPPIRASQWLHFRSCIAEKCHQKWQGNYHATQLHWAWPLPRTPGMRGMRGIGQ